MSLIAGRGVSPAPSSGSAHTRAHCRRSGVTRMMLKKTAHTRVLQQPARTPGRFSTTANLKPIGSPCLSESSHRNLMILPRVR